MHSITLSSGQKFEAEDGEPLLDAALRAGLVLEHSCRTGRCSSCKARVLSGDTAALQAESGLKDAGLASPPWILTCVRAATSALQLEAGVVDADLPRSQITPAKIDRLEPLSPDIARVMLRLPPRAAFRYLPGQYLDVVGPGKVRRSYSLAAAARDGAPLELHVRRVPGGALSEYWFAGARAGDLLQVVGPKGTFFLRRPLPTTLCLLATGTGMAPIMALLQQVAALPADEKPVRTVLFWGNRHPEDFYVDPASLLPDLDYRPVISGPRDMPGALRGRLTHHLATAGLDPARTAVYACGSPAMIQEARSLLVGDGLPEGSFHSDAFVSSATQTETSNR